MPNKSCSHIFNSWFPLLPLCSTTRKIQLYLRYMSRFMGSKPISILHLFHFLSFSALFFFYSLIANKKKMVLTSFNPLKPLSSPYLPGSYVCDVSILIQYVVIFPSGTLQTCHTRYLNTPAVQMTSYAFFNNKMIHFPCTMH